MQFGQCDFTIIAILIFNMWFLNMCSHDGDDDDVYIYFFLF